jgi:hypothetical protein
MTIYNTTNMGTYIVPVAAGILAANQFGFTMIEKASVALAALPEVEPQSIRRELGH